MFYVKALEDYVNLQNDIKEDGFFDIDVQLSTKELPKEDLIEITHTFNVVGYQEEEEEEENSGHGVNISRGTNFDQMIEDTKE